MLRSRWHGALSGSLMLLTYTASGSGRSFTIPVMYAVTGSGFVALATAPDRKRWWRAFRSGAPATLRISGRDVGATGRLLSGGEARQALTDYLTRFPRAAGTLGATADGSAAELDAAARAAVLVLFEVGARA